MARSRKRKTARYGAILLALACTMTFAGLAVHMWQIYGRGTIEYVEIEGELGDVERGIVEQRLATIDRNDPDIARVRHRLEALSWVKRVSVRRLWPAGLLVRVAVHRAIARWGDDAYLSDRGVTFTLAEPSTERLPRLAGPRGSEHRMMEQYQQLSRAFQPSGQVITDVELGARGDWVVRLDSGVVVRLGKEDISDRLVRLKRVADRAELLARIDEIAEIDARYTNGVAVKWRKDLCGSDCLNVAGNDNLKRVHTL